MPSIDPQSAPATNVFLIPELYGLLNRSVVQLSLVFSYGGNRVLERSNENTLY
jgi:hypothetical protein